MSSEFAIFWEINAQQFKVMIFPVATNIIDIFPWYSPNYLNIKSRIMAIHWMFNTFFPIACRKILNPSCHSILSQCTLMKSMLCPRQCGSLSIKVQYVVLSLADVDISKNLNTFNFFGHQVRIQNPLESIYGENMSTFHFCHGIRLPVGRYGLQSIEWWVM